MKYDAPKVKFLQPSKLWFMYFEHQKMVVLEDWVFDGTLVRAGTVTDGATVPFPFSLVIPRDGNFHPCGVAHDVDTTNRQLPRLESDRRFKRRLRALGVPRWRAYFAYIGVRLYSYYKYLRYNHE